MTPEKWSAILVALVTLIFVAGAGGFVVLRLIKKSPAVGWLAIAAVLVAYAGLVVYFVGASYVELPIVFGAKAGLLGLFIGIIGSRFWRPVAAT